MPVIDRISRSSEETNGLNLVVTLHSPREIRVGKGAFRIARSDYVLDDNVNHIVSGHADYSTKINGFLAVAPDETVEVIVDECIGDGLDLPFNFFGSGYKLLTRLFQIQTPPGDFEIGDLEVQVTRIIPHEVTSARAVRSEVIGEKVRHPEDPAQAPRVREEGGES